MATEHTMPYNKVYVAINVDRAAVNVHCKQLGDNRGTRNQSPIVGFFYITTEDLILSLNLTFKCTSL